MAFTLKVPKHRELSGGDLVAQCLRQIGVEVAFGIHGGHLDAFLVGCEENGIRLVDTRHEATAVQAAQGYAHVTHKLGVAFATANSGFGNSLPGIATALADRSPVLVVTSSLPMRDAETNCLQGFLDQPVVANGITKFAHRVLEVEEIPRLVARAQRVCISGTPGPVVLDFPIDILFRPVRQSQISWGSIAAPVPHPPAPSQQAIVEATNLWRAAKRPAIIIGTGCRTSEVSYLSLEISKEKQTDDVLSKASRELSALLEKTQTPLFHSQKGFGAISVDHPLQAGLVANLISLPESAKPDLIMLLGTRTGMFLGGRSGAVLPNTGCKYIQVDIDGSEIARQIPIDVGIISDAHQALLALNKAVSETPFSAPSSWKDTALSQRRAPSVHEKEECLVHGSMHPYHALRGVFESIKPGAIISIDGGEAGSWSTDLTEAAKPFLTLFAAGYIGMLGNGWGYSLGAAVGDPSLQVINVQGDGSAGFAIGELDTYARHGLNILTVVMNNHIWAMSLHGQDLVYKTTSLARPVSSLSKKMSFHSVTEGFGMPAGTVSDPSALATTVQKLSSSEGPALLELLISGTPTHPGTTAMIGDTDDPNVIVVPYYDNVSRPYFKA